MSDPLFAPGWPGISPTWTSSAKSGVGTALNASSRVWFTLSHGILNEIYYPRTDRACTRDFGLIVTEGKSFFSEEKRSTTSEISCFKPGVPGFRVVNTCRSGRYRITKEILADPGRDALLQRTAFTALKGRAEDYSLFAILAPHIANRGTGNTAWIGEYEGMPMLFAERDGTALALAASVPWLKRSAGFVGISDGWQDIRANNRMTWAYERAENGNVALAGQVNWRAASSFTFAIGFGHAPEEAAHQARASLLENFDDVRSAYEGEWQAWHKEILDMADPHEKSGQSLYRTSVAVIKTHEDKHFPGGLIASLSIPWGMQKGDDDLGGYHLVWPRDLVESAGALLAAGAGDDVKRILNYLAATQQKDGHWAQNQWLDGAPYWNGIQMDETAFPILLVELAARQGVLSAADYWPMAKNAAGYIVRNGPVTQQDRWEEDPGYSPFTLAVEIAALLTAAAMADQAGDARLGRYLRDTADAWNDHVEAWTYVTGTDLAKACGVDGYYVRIAPAEEPDAASPTEGFVPIKNRTPGHSELPVTQLVSPDALALVRLGLRSARDPRIVNTVKVVDWLLKKETPYGPAWHRYNGDGYGEHEDGSGFDGTGVGRLWPLLTGERGHYELAAGRRDEAERLLETMAGLSNLGGLLPEQTWDGKNIESKELYFGKPSGSAMPLVWAHAEYVKLLRSIRDGRVFDAPPEAVKRYAEGKTASCLSIWRYNQKSRILAAGKTLRIELLSPALIHWGIDGWRQPQDTPTEDAGLGVHVADLDTGRLPEGSTVQFTFYWNDADRWEGADFEVRVTTAEKKFEALTKTKRAVEANRAFPK